MLIGVRCLFLLSKIWNWRRLRDFKKWIFSQIMNEKVVIIKLYFIFSFHRSSHRFFGADFTTPEQFKGAEKNVPLCKVRTCRHWTTAQENPAERTGEGRERTAHESCRGRRIDKPFASVLAVKTGVLKFWSHLESSKKRFFTSKFSDSWNDLRGT